MRAFSISARARRITPATPSTALGLQVDGLHALQRLLTGPGGANPLDGTAISRMVVDRATPTGSTAATADRAVNSNFGFGRAGVAARWQQLGEPDGHHIERPSGPVPRPQFRLPGRRQYIPARTTISGSSSPIPSPHTPTHFGMSTDAFGNPVRQHYTWRSVLPSATLYPRTPFIDS